MEQERRMVTGTAGPVLLVLTVLAVLARSSPVAVTACRPYDDSVCSALCRTYVETCSNDGACSACATLQDLCEPRPSCEQIVYHCWDALLACADHVTLQDSLYPDKRSTNRGFAFLFLKLHPLFTRMGAPPHISSARFRRIGGRFGSEFLGKRTMEFSPDEEDVDAFRDKRKGPPPSKYGNEFLGKRNQEGIGRKRGRSRYPLNKGREFLGKRGGGEDLSGFNFSGSNETAYDGTEDEYVAGFGDFDAEEAESKRATPRNKARKIGSELLGKRLGYVSNTQGHSSPKWVKVGEPEYPDYTRFGSKNENKIPRKISEFLG